MKKNTLDNGLEILTNKMVGSLSVSMGVWIKAGGRTETNENSGISHFLEHLLFKGTKNFSSKRLKEAVEGVGGSFNGFTSMEYTCFLVKVLEKHFGLGIDILSDMIINPLLRKPDVEKERFVILEEIKMYQDQPGSLVHDFLDELLWPNHSLGRQLTGTIDIVSKMTHQGIKQYKKELYVPNNMMITASGNVNHELFVKRVRKIFKDIPKGKPCEFEPNKTSKHTALKLFNKDIEQCRFAMGFHAFERKSPYRFVLSLLNIILGGNMSSRLFNEVREKRGLAYDISSSIRRYSDAGVFLVDGGVDQSKVVDCLKVIIQQIQKITKSQVSQDELQRAKEYYIGQFSLMMEETLENMLWLGEEYLESGKVISKKSIEEAIRKITPKDILEVCKMIFRKENLHLSIVGPISKTIQKQIKELV